MFYEQKVALRILPSPQGLRGQLYQKLNMKIKKRVLIQGEPGNTCCNYPNSEFESYRECDYHYMKTRVEKVAPGLMPVWMTEDLSKVTVKPVVVPMNRMSKFKTDTDNFFTFQVLILAMSPLAKMNLIVHFHARSIQ